MSATTLYDTSATPFGNSHVREESAAASRPASGLVRKIAAIRGLALFAGVSEDALRSLATSAIVRRFERGRRIARLGAKDECVILLSGRAKTSMPRGKVGGNLMLATLHAGDVVSENCWASEDAILDGEAIALNDCEAIFLPRRALEDFLQGHGEVAVRLLVAAVNKLGRQTRLAMKHRSFDVGDRLYCKLVEFAASLGRRVEGGISIEHGLQQNELASSIGASREAVNRQLASWRDRGLVTFSRGVLLVNDPAGLGMVVSAEARSVGFDPDPSID